MTPVVALQKTPEPVANEIAALFERLACDPNVSVDKIERLMALWERSEARKAEAAFNAAMSTAQSEMRPVATDASNPSTRSRYASYEQLDRALRPIYTSHGFGLSFDTGEAPSVDWVRVLCYVTHAVGHARTYHVDMPADGKGAKGGDVMTKTHAVGSAMSYGMRYLLRLIFNVAVGEGDDDGNAAARPAGPTMPAGYPDWLDTLHAVAVEGTPRLQATWGVSKREYRDYLTRVEPQKWQAIKAKAARRVP